LKRIQIVLAILVCLVALESAAEAEDWYVSVGLGAGLVRNIGTHAEEKILASGLVTNGGFRVDHKSHPLVASLGYTGLSPYLVVELEYVRNLRVSVVSHATTIKGNHPMMSDKKVVNEVVSLIPQLKLPLLWIPDTFVFVGAGAGLGRGTLSRESTPVSVADGSSVHYRFVPVMKFGFLYQEAGKIGFGPECTFFATKAGECSINVRVPFQWF
jgi:hypothetical protein